MLNQDTKRKIDSARNILVGKVPDPKAQVEQITTALIYKFMDDMDKEAQELGGKARFFTMGYEKYAWSKLMDAKLGGHDRLDLYIEAITSLSQNPHIPQLFRDIFKDTFLPYRNPETLSLFLKEINGFSYDNSEDLGNAFEYLLSILGSQGDAGQFRTPRHIIDFIVAAVDPKKDEMICDPACGTAGFLISAYKHILSQHDGINDPENSEKPLTPDERKTLMDHFAGYDISPDMVRLSKVNLYLHGFPSPTIFEYDTLSSEEKWDDSFDVMLANPPFMSPTGGIKPHKRFSVQANRSEVLFVDYILEHLRPKGRAGIIVPEGIIFQSAGAYKQLRKMLVEDGLMAVVSLPAGVFNPYAGVKTSILLFDNEIAKKTKNILFLKIQNDGYDLGAQRREHDKNDLPLALEIIKKYKRALKDDVDFEFSENKNNIANLVTKEKIAETGDYSLSGERYVESVNFANQKWPMSELMNVCVVDWGNTNLTKSTYKSDGQYLAVSATGGDGRIDHYEHEVGVTVLSAIGANCGKLFFPNEKFTAIKNTITFTPDQTKVLPKYLFYVLNDNKFPIRGGGQPFMSKGDIQKYQIPLPPIEVQNEIVEQIEVKQNAIGHAKAIIQNLERERRYFGQSLRKLEGVEMVKLKDICEINRRTDEPTKLYGKDAFAYIDISSVENGTGILNYENMIIPSKAPSRARRIIQNGDVLLSTVRPNLKAFAYLENLPSKALASTGFAVLTAKVNVSAKYVFHLLFADDLQNQMAGRMGKGSYPSINQDDVEQLSIPLPSLEIQKELVAEAEKEQQIINVNKQLIEIYEQKIKSVISEI
jgi:type I restriction enzyme M protein